MAANETERRRWNDEAWTGQWTKREQMTSLVTPVLLEALAPARGERVLDVGCGGGRTTLAVASRVGDTGAVVGLDLSGPLTELARERAREAGATNATFVVGDAQVDSVEGGPFDAATSQFGVMFFEDPGGAFANLARHLRPGGRLAFACWQSPAVNPWFVGPALAGLVPPPPPPAPGRRPTGPFSLCDAGEVRQLLATAGFASVTIEGHEHEHEVAETSLVDEAQLVFMGVPEDALGAARAAIDAHLEPFRQPSGTLRFPLAFQVVRAHRPA